jgi:hypothetical protein
LHYTRAATLGFPTMQGAFVESILICIHAHSHFSPPANAKRRFDFTRLAPAIAAARAWRSPTEEPIGSPRG